MQPQRVGRIRVVDDASTLVVASGKARAHKAPIESSSKHALSLVVLRKNRGDSSSLG